MSEKTPEEVQRILQDRYPVQTGRSERYYRRRGTAEEERQRAILVARYNSPAFESEIDKSLGLFDGWLRDET